MAALLTIGKLAAGQQQYYLDTVAGGAEEYYTTGKEQPGRWCGASAARLHLAGQVEPDALHRLLDHVHPTTGERLTDGRSDPKVIGFDATFCSPKSVSLLFALADPHVSMQVADAHAAAVSDALAAFETMARGRRGHGGARTVTGEGFVAAGFRHRTSRAGDPLLHTHVVIANLVYAAEDGRWSALDGRPIHTWARPVGHLYEAQLRWELTRRLGVGWGPVTNGIADIAGIDRAVLDAFSTRRNEIRAHLAERNEHGAKAAQRAAYITRAPKDPNLNPGDLLPAWRARADALGFDHHALQATLHQTNQHRSASVGINTDRMFQDLAGPDGLTANRATFGRAQVINAICDALPNGAPVTDVLEMVEQFLHSEHVIALTPTVAPTLHTRRGGLVPAGAIDGVYTTPNMLAAEQRLLDLATQPSTTLTADHRHIEHAIGRRGTLSDEQAAMVRAVCASTAGVDIVEGVAGAGKTFALAAANDAWTASGLRVRGACLAARAAEQLQTGSGIPSSTLDRLLRDLDSDDPLTNGDIVVIDEAAMVGTRTLARLLEHARRANAKVVLIGDPRQLPEIEAGGAVSAFTARLGARKLTTNRRQHQPWERHALTDLRDGHIDQALNTYQTHQRVHIRSQEGVDVRDVLVADWWHARTHGQDGLMIALRLNDVEDLNRRARQHLRHAGQLGPDQLTVGHRAFAEGDHVLALRNNYQLGILNGTRGQITTINPAHRTVTMQVDTSASIDLPYSYIADGHLTHGYATTLHKAQGATVNRTFILADTTYTKEHLYTALSRGAARNDLYLNDTDHRAGDRHAPETTTPIEEAFRAAVQRSSAQHLALDHPTHATRTTDQPVTADASRSRRVPNRDSQAVTRDDSQSRTLTLRQTQSELHRVNDQLDTARRQRDHHRRQAATAQTAIDQLGPIGRRLHRGQLRERQSLNATATGNLNRANNYIEHLAARQRQLTTEQDRLVAEHHRLTAESERRAARERRAAELATPAARPDRPHGIGAPTVDLHALLEGAFRASDRAEHRTPDHEPDIGMDLGL